MRTLRNTKRQMRSRRKSKPRRRGIRPSGMDVGVRLPVQYAWKVLDRLVTDLAEYLPEDDINHIRRAIRARSIDDIVSLANQWGLQSINSSGEIYSPVMGCRLLLGAVIKKYPFPGKEKEKAEVALKNLRAGEISCSLFNRKGWKSLFLDGRPIRELMLMREFIEKTIGLFPPEWDLITERSRHGPGSDTGTSRGNNSLYDKYVNWPYHVTRQSLEHARRLISNDERWLGALEDSYRRRFHIPMWSILDQDAFWANVFHVVDANRITTVPKDGFKDRPIAIEPRMNLMLQLGVDGFVRRRLKRWGINLDSQSKNQELARLGSLRKDADTPVTIDLSNASDTVSLRLVKLLFPKPWYSYLCDIRSPKGLFPSGEKLRLSKLSSMGNGYTFAIESLIFGAIAYAAEVTTYGSWQRDTTAVFGDDIIVPQACAPCLLNLLRFTGFSVNTEKSFLFGNVRESCGTDWVSGVDVRPVFLKEHPETVDVLFAHRNLLSRWAYLTLGKGLESVEALYLSWIPERFHLYGPVSDEEFSTYLHTPDPGVYSNWSWTFKALECRPLGRKGNDFLFRKLMHPLRPTALMEYREPWRRARSLTVSVRDLVLASGSVFTVTTRNRVAYRMRNRRVPFWNADYRMPTPLK